MAYKFEIGDVVRKRYGTKTIVVREIYSNFVYGTYQHSGTSTGRLEPSNLVKVENTNSVEEKGYGKMKGKLFQTKDGAFGIGLAVNSAGKYVLEMKGTGDLVAYDKSEVELVMPFTYNVQFNGTGTEYAYLGKEGVVKVGDLLLKTDTKGFSIGRVTAVNTKSERATKYFDGAKIMTEALDQ
jgi:hypothetical protein